MASGEDDGDSQNARMRVAAGRRAVFPMLAALVAGAAVWSGVGHRIVGGWQPQGDDAEIAWLTHNVFTHRIPQVGMPSTVGGHGSPAHHWGPLLFWVLALPQRVASEHPVSSWGWSFCNSSHWVRSPDSLRAGSGASASWR